jgi:hypothetical protein
MSTRNGLRKKFLGAAPKLLCERVIGSLGVLWLLVPADRMIEAACTYAASTR